MQGPARVKFLTETPELHSSEEAQEFIRQEVGRPSKVWAHEVVACARETEFVKLRTPDFVLLPDINCHRRQGRPYRTRLALRQETEAPRAPRRFNWLVIMTSPALRSIRDLRGEHIPLLQRMQATCVAAIQQEYQVAAEDIMVFANYPPSVYRLHFHFCVPFFKPTAFDAFRMHTLSAIINNLRIHSDYYWLSTFQIPVHSNSDLYRVFDAGARDCEGGSGDEAARLARPFGGPE